MTETLEKSHGGGEKLILNWMNLEGWSYRSFGCNTAAGQSREELTVVDEAECQNTQDYE